MSDNHKPNIIKYLDDNALKEIKTWRSVTYCQIGEGVTDGNFRTALPNFKGKKFVISYMHGVLGNPGIFASGLAEFIPKHFNVVPDKGETSYIAIIWIRTQ